MARTRLAVGIIGLGIAYWALAEVGGILSFPGGVQVAWLPAGFAAAVLCLGDLRWAIGAAVADLLLGTGVSPFQATLLLHDPTVLVQTLGNTLEFVLAAYLLRIWLGRDCRLERPADIGRLLLVFAIAVPVSAALGTLSSWQAGYVTAAQSATFLRTWLLADGAGAMLVVPLILVWRTPWPGRPTPRAALEAVLIMAAVVALSVAGFGSPHPITYIVFPALVVAAVRLGQRGATVALLLAFAVAIAVTSRNIGPFVTRSIDDEVLTTQLYMLVATLTVLALGAAISDRQRAAIALAESRQRESERAAEERQRIARDLHDSVSQTLYSLGLHAGIAQHEIAQGGAPVGGRLSAAVQEVVGLAHGALLEMRASIFELRGGAVAEQGLVAALSAHCTAQSLRHDVHIDVTGPPERLHLDAPVEELLFRIGQEAVTNAVKHSASEIVSVQVSEGQGRVTLGVRDDGVGFDPEQAYAGHLGLDLLRSRAAEAGGTATIDSCLGSRHLGRRERPGVAHRCGGPRPSLTASSAACVRELSPSLRRMWLTWVRAVRSLMTRWRAISLLARPAAISRKISSSRSDRSAKGLSLGPADGRREATNRAGDRPVEVYLATVGGADRQRQLLGRGVLDQVTGGAGLQGGLHPRLVDHGGHGNHLDTRHRRAHLAGRLDAVHRLHHQVHEDDVRWLALGCHRAQPFQCLSTVGGLADHLDVVEDREVGAHAAAHHPVVVDDEHADRLVGFDVLGGGVWRIGHGRIICPRDRIVIQDETVGVVTATDVPLPRGDLADVARRTSRCGRVIGPMRQAVRSLDACWWLTSAGGSTPCGPPDRTDRREERHEHVASSGSGRRRRRVRAPARRQRFGSRSGEPHLAHRRVPGLPEPDGWRPLCRRPRLERGTPVSSGRHAGELEPHRSDRAAGPQG